MPPSFINKDISSGYLGLWSAWRTVTERSVQVQLPLDQYGIRNVSPSRHTTAGVQRALHPVGCLVNYTPVDSHRCDVPGVRIDRFSSAVRWRIQ